MVENKAKKSIVKEEKVKKENPKQLKESKEYKLKNLTDFYEKELISKEVYEKRQLEILSE